MMSRAVAAVLELAASLCCLQVDVKKATPKEKMAAAANRGRGAANAPGAGRGRGRGLSALFITSANEVLIYPAFHCLSLAASRKNYRSYFHENKLYQRYICGQ